MATVLPPPNKRQRLETAERAREQQDVRAIPEGLGSVRVQFFDQSTGKATGGAVSIPVADTTVKNLELLLNSLQGHVGLDFVRFDRQASMLNLLDRMLRNGYHIASHSNEMLQIRLVPQHWIYLATSINHY